MKSPQKSSGLRIWTLIAAAFFAGSLYMFAATRSFVSRALPAVGTLTGVERHTFRRGGPRYYPQITFVTATGQKALCVGRNGRQSPESYRIGSQVPVLYDPQMPQNNRIYSWISLWFPSAFLAFMAFFFFLPAVVGAVKRMIIQKLLAKAGVPSAAASSSVTPPHVIR